MSDISKKILPPISEERAMRLLKAQGESVIDCPCIISNCVSVRCADCVWNGITDRRHSNHDNEEETMHEIEQILSRIQHEGIDIV